MPRTAREKSSSGVYHIMIRGINKQNIFQEKEDYEKFISIMRYYKEVSKYDLYGYCLMDNHVHLLMKEVDESISKTIKRFSSSYVHWYNKKYERFGHLFQERFKSEVVESYEYLLGVLRYIHQNPLKAGIVKNIEDYEWTSNREYISKQEIIDTDFILKIFSENKKDAIELYKEYIYKPNNAEFMDNDSRKKLTDSEIKSYLSKIGIKNVEEIKQLEKNERDRILKMIKSIEGITIRQISRITGISKSVIGRI